LLADGITALMNKILFASKQQVGWGIDQVK